MYVNAEYSLRSGAIDTGNMSLIQVTEHGCSNVLLVHWAVVASRTGQRVVLDEDGRIVYSMHVRHGWKSYVGCVIVHPDVGLALQRRGPRDRNQFPQSMLRLWRMWECGLVRCGAGAGGGDDDDDRADGAADFEGEEVCEVCSVGPSVYKCALCLHCWHQECCYKIAKWVIEGGR